jgi:hypothetical protein
MEFVLKMRDISLQLAAFGILATVSGLCRFSLHALRSMCSAPNRVPQDYRRLANVFAPIVSFASFSLWSPLGSQIQQHPLFEFSTWVVAQTLALILAKEHQGALVDFGTDLVQCVPRLYLVHLASILEDEAATLQSCPNSHSLISLCFSRARSRGAALCCVAQARIVDSHLAIV